MRIIYTDIFDNTDKRILARYQITLIAINTLDSALNIKDILNLESCIGYYKHISMNGVPKLMFYIKDKMYFYHSIFEYLEQHQYYKTGKTLGLSPYKDQQEVVEFKNHFWKFINSQIFFKELMKMQWISNYMKSIENSGVFFRLSKNKRQRTYWNPVLNAGLPMINKAHKGLLREITFFCHDVGHFLLPDLVYTGSDETNDKLCRQIYCLYRLLGEATTLPINEMYIVQAYENNKDIRNLDPNWVMDLPYLLFKEIKYNANIEDILWASVYFFVKGDWSKFQDLINRSNGNPDVLNKFGERYEEVNKRGVEWTCDNYDNMYLDRSAYKRWWQYVGAYCNDINVMTIDEMKKYLVDNKDNSDIIDVMYKLVLPKIMNKLTSDVELKSEARRNYLAFKKWIIGNILLFFKYDYFEDVVHILDNILINLNKLSIEPNDYNEIINQTIDMYKEALKIGLELRKIDPDDYFTFIGVYPMIDNNVLNENSDKKTLRDYLVDYGLIE